MWRMKMFVNKDSICNIWESHSNPYNQKNELLVLYWSRSLKLGENGWFWYKISEDSKPPCKLSSWYNDAWLLFFTKTSGQIWISHWMIKWNSSFKSLLRYKPFEKTYFKFAPANYWPKHRKKLKISKMLLPFAPASSSHAPASAGTSETSLLMQVEHGEWIYGLILCILPWRCHRNWAAHGLFRETSHT